MPPCFTFARPSRLHRRVLPDSLPSGRRLPHARGAPPGRQHLPSPTAAPRGPCAPPQPAGRLTSAALLPGFRFVSPRLKLPQGRGPFPTRLRGAAPHKGGMHPAPSTHRRVGAAREPQGVGPACRRAGGRAPAAPGDPGPSPGFRLHGSTAEDPARPVRPATPQGAATAYLT